MARRMGNSLFQDTFFGGVLNAVRQGPEVAAAYLPFSPIYVAGISDFGRRDPSIVSGAKLLRGLRRSFLVCATFGAGCINVAGSAAGLTKLITVQFRW